MKINKNSWHFKLQEKYDTHTQYRLYANATVSLCTYFWATVGCLLLGLKDVVFYVVAAVMAALLGLALVSPLYFFWVAFTGLDFAGQDYSITGAVILATELFFTILVGCLLVKDGDMKVWPKWLPVNKLFTKSKPVKAKQPSLFVEYFKAKKAKICPLIKLEE